MAHSNKFSKRYSTRNTSRATAALCLGVLGAASLQAVGCSSEFHSCNESRTCVPTAGSGASDAGEAGVGNGGATHVGGAGGRAGSSGAPVELAGEGGDDASAGSAGEGSVAGGGGASGGDGLSGGAGVSGGGASNGGAGAGGSGGTLGGAGAAPVDTTPPAIVSITPANGAKGIAADTKIVITFSEPVDKPAAEAAVLTTAGNVTFSWNANATVLTATPTNLLAYAAGATANSYTVQVSTGLKDLAGNHSNAAFNSSFSTLRQIPQTITRGVPGCYEASNLSTPYQLESFASAYVGDNGDNSVARFFPDFDISALPQTLTSVVSATLTIPIQASPALDVHWGTPFVDLGNLIVDHVYESSFNSSTATKARLSTIGTLMPASATPFYGDKTIDVTAALTDDIVNRIARNNHSMYRLGFTTKTDNDATIDCVAVVFNTTMSLSVVYLIP